MHVHLKLIYRGVDVNLFFERLRSHLVVLTVNCVTCSGGFALRLEKLMMLKFKINLTINEAWSPN